MKALGKFSIRGRERAALSLCFLLVVLPGAVKAEEGFLYVSNGEEVTITGYECWYPDPTIPNTIEGLPVTAIGSYAFYGCNLESVVIPDSVRRIGMHAFMSSANLTNISLGNGVTEIGYSAFAGCLRLAEIRIPASVTNIVEFAFYYCLGMKAFTVEAENAFYSSLDGVLFDKGRTRVIQYPAGKVGSYVMPNSVTNFDGAFCYATNLTSIAVSEGARSIGFGDFEGCTGLISVHIPNSVTAIGDFAFRDCWNLKSVTIPDSVTRLGEYAFRSCTTLTNVTLGQNVARIGGLAFADCLNLTSITIPGSVRSIGLWAFYFCPKLTNVSIGSGLEVIESAGFSYCHTLTSLVLPASLRHIDTNAFDGCFSLTNVYFRGDAPRIADKVFWTTNTATVHYLPGTSGWDATFAGQPTAVWHLPQPVILPPATSFGLRTNRFGFVVSWATNADVVIEARHNLMNWLPIATNALSNGWTYFSEPANRPKRFYRVRSQ